MLEYCLRRVRETGPLVHCITNFVTVNDCANIVLACGGSPTMAHHKDEVADITEMAQCLVLNMGNISDVEAMICAGKRSNQLSHPVVMDPVGVASSPLRRVTFAELKLSMQFSLVRGNATEIRFLATGLGKNGGVDAAISDKITPENIGEFARMAADLARRLGCVVSISGAIDVVASGERAYAVYGGCPEMSRITGTGCMLTSLMGAFLGANPEKPLEATLAAACAMKVAGDIAREKTEAAHGGTMTLRMYLIDAISLMDGKTLKERAHYEEIPLRHL